MKLIIPGEYNEVAKFFISIHRGEELRMLHATPISKAAAIALCFRMTGLIPAFRGGRGRANHKRISLPNVSPGILRPDGVPYLRLGVVLHECAHTLDIRELVAGRIERKTWKPHGITFKLKFLELIKSYAQDDKLKMVASL